MTHGTKKTKEQCAHHSWADVRRAPQYRDTRNTEFVLQQCTHKNCNAMRFL